MEKCKPVVVFSYSRYNNDGQVRRCNLMMQEAA